MHPSIYAGREQAYVKHFVLTHYLEKLAFKVGQFQPGTTLNYIDGFSGPWDTQDANARDSSPALALRELLKAKNALKVRNVVFTPRCMFVEKDRWAHARLVALCDQHPRGVEAHPHAGEFESSIDVAAKFAPRERTPKLGKSHLVVLR